MYLSKWDPISIPRITVFIIVAPVVISSTNQNLHGASASQSIHWFFNVTNNQYIHFLCPQGLKAPFATDLFFN